MISHIKEQKQTKLIAVLIVYTLLSSLSILACKQLPKEETNTEETKIRQIHKDYVNGWKNNNESQVMELLEDNAQIQPNMFNPIKGKENIRQFWFPKDSSVTTINEFSTEITYIEVMDTIALTTHHSVLDWNYQKDSIAFGMIQKGYNTTIYRKQPNSSWKIWRSMWTDLDAKTK